MECAGTAYAGHGVDDDVGFAGECDGMLEPLAGFSGGEPAGAAGDVVGRVEGVDVASGFEKGFIGGVVQGASHGDCGDVEPFRCEHRTGIEPIAAVVACAGEHADAQAGLIPVLLVYHVEDGARRGAGGHAHEGDFVGEQRLFERAYGRGVECRCGQGVGVVCCLVVHGNRPYVLWPPLPHKICRGVAGMLLFTLVPWVRTRSSGSADIRTRTPTGEHALSYSHNDNQSIPRFRVSIIAPAVHHATGPLWRRRRKGVTYVHCGPFCRWRRQHVLRP